MPTHRHFIIYKPYGFLSQFIVNGKRKKRHRLLGELHEFPADTMSVGRLDLHSEGLLFLTTDGRQSYEVTTGRKVEKEYYAQVDGLIDAVAIQQLQTGVTITVNGSSYETRACAAFKIEPAPIFPPRAKKIRSEQHGATSWVSITIKEGKFRQVRKMTAAVGFPTLRLVRVRIGTIRLGDMNAGEVKEVENFGM